MTWKVKVIAGIVLVAVSFGSGYLFKSYRTSNEIAGYSKRELENEEKKKANDAAVNELKGQNKLLLERVAQQGALDESIKAVTESRGGQIAAEVKNLEAINAELKTNLKVVANPTDPCTWCREHSAAALKRGQISKPLACKEECPSPAR